MDMSSYLKSWSKNMTYLRRHMSLQQHWLLFFALSCNIPQYYENYNNNNRSFYCLSDKDTQDLLFTGINWSICLHIFLFSVSALFNNLCICGIALFLCLSVKVLLTIYFSLPLLGKPSKKKLQRKLTFVNFLKTCLKSISSHFESF